MYIGEAALTDAYGIGRVQFTSWHTMFPDAGYAADAYLAQFSAEQRGERWASLLASDKVQFTLVARTDAGEVVGFAYGVPLAPDAATPYTSELAALHLLPEYRGQGLGTRLMQAFAKTLHAHGADSMLLWVLTENTRARQFYERAGGQYCDAKQSVAGTPPNTLTINEVAYGWADITALW